MLGDRDTLAAVGRAAILRPDVRALVPPAPPASAAVAVVGSPSGPGRPCCLRGQHDKFAIFAITPHANAPGQRKFSSSYVLEAREYAVLTSSIDTAAACACSRQRSAGGYSANYIIKG